MITFPQDKKFFQSNRSDVLGNLWSTKNIDLQSNLGRIRLAEKLKINTSGVTNQGLPTAIIKWGSYYYAIMGTRIFTTYTNMLLTSAFVEDTSTGAKTNYTAGGDLCVFNGQLFATTATRLVSLDSVTGGTWTERDTVTIDQAGFGKLNRLIYFRKFDRLYFFRDSSSIFSLDASYVVTEDGQDFSIEIPGAEGGLLDAIASDNDFWIVTQRDSSLSGDPLKSQSVISHWDGRSNQVTGGRVYPIEGTVRAMAMGENGEFYVMDSHARLLRYTGYGFQELGRLPIRRDLLTKATSNLADSFIHPNGMTVTPDGTVLMNINNLVGDNTGSIKENIPSGIWEWSQETGFVHKHSFTLMGLTTPVNITDWGQNRVAGVGALAQAALSTTSASGRATIIAGATYYTNASTTVHGIFVDAPVPTNNATTGEGQKAGYFVTTWIESPFIQDIWQKIYIKYRQFLATTDKIVVKYRLTEADPVYFDMTWVNTTSFTTTTDLSSKVGQEVEVLQGTGSGGCAHIVSVTGTSTFTVTVDETFTGVTTGTAKGRVQAWVKLGEAADQYSEFKEMMIGKVSPRIQIKVFMRFTGDNEFHEFKLLNTRNETA